MSENFTVSDIIESVQKLPAAPRIMPKLQALLRDPNSSLEDITRLLKLDSALSAQIVRLSNSAYYGTAQQVAHIEAAVNRVGFYEVFKLAGVVASQEMLQGRLTLYNLENNELWEQSIAAASLMGSLAHLVGISDDTAYLAGLLHGIGKIVIDTFYTEQGITYDMSGLRSVTPDEEFEALGFTYAHVGGGLLNKWNFIQEIAIPIEFQLAPMDAPEEQRGVATMLHLGIRVLECLRDDPEGVEDTFDPDPDLLSEVALTTSDLIDIGIKAVEMSNTLIKSLDSAK